VDDHADVAVVPSASVCSAANELPALGPFIEVAPIRLTPPPAIALESDLYRTSPFVRFERAHPPARAPPRLA
jgi:hypothetical protein